jgi:predicted cupin superfamily sugar epimerase
MALDVEGVTSVVGPDAGAGHELHVLVPAGAWQSATPAGDAWSLVACVVAPGFDFADFEMSS